MRGDCGGECVAQVVARRPQLPEGAGCGESEPPMKMRAAERARRREHGAQRVRGAESADVCRA